MKNRRAIYFLFAANSVAGFAQGITMFAIPWHFNNVLNMPTQFGTISIIITFLSLLWGLYAGTLIDRYNRKNIFLATNTSGFLIFGSIALFGFFGELSPLLVSIVFGAMFFIYTIHYPNLFAFAQEITEPRDYNKVISWIEIQGQTTSAISMAFAAILYEGSKRGYINLFGFPVHIGIDIEPWTLPQILLLNTVTFLISILFIVPIRFQAVAHRTPEITSVWERLQVGFNFLKKHPLIFLFGTASFCIFITILVIGFYLNPIYIKQHLNKEPSVYASYEMYFALGSLFAGMGITALFRSVNNILAIILLSLSVTAIYLLCMFNIPLAVFYAVGIVQGFSNAGTRILRMTYLFHHIPNQLIGRTGGVFITLSISIRLMFLFLLSRPFFVEGDNVIYSFGILGIFVFVSTLILLANYRKLVEMPGTPG